MQHAGEPISRRFICMNAVVMPMSVMPMTPHFTAVWVPMHSQWNNQKPRTHDATRKH